MAFFRRRRQPDEDNFEKAWQTIRDERLAEEIGQEIARNISRVGVPAITPAITGPGGRTLPGTSLRFLKAHQFLTVPANSTKTVYYYRLPGNHMGAIQRVGNTHYADTKSRWLVDGKEVYESPIERELADINSPVEIRPPITVSERIEWIVKNESGENDYVYHVVIDGISCHKDEFTLLLSWL
jgi:hypothetical protein